MAAKVADCHSLTSYYEKLYKQHYQNSPNTNRFSARWGFDSVLQSMGFDEAKSLLEYYFTTPGSKNHSLDWFFYHYHELIDSQLKNAEDRIHRKKLLEESKARAERWKDSGKQGIGNN